MDYLFVFLVGGAFGILLTCFSMVVVSSIKDFKKNKSSREEELLLPDDDVDTADWWKRGESPPF